MCTTYKAWFSVSSPALPDLVLRFPQAGCRLTPLQMRKPGLRDSSGVLPKITQAVSPDFPGGLTWSPRSAPSLDLALEGTWPLFGENWLQETPSKCGEWGCPHLMDLKQDKT